MQYIQNIIAERTVRGNGDHRLIVPVAVVISPENN
jgi:hypothetical protein